MRILKTFFRPVHTLMQAVLLPFKALFVVGLCALINLMTAPGHWWFQWVALGMGIAVLLAWARAARLLLTLAVIAWAARWVHRRYGDQARAQFDDWVQRTQPQPAQVFEALRLGAPGSTAPR